MGIEKSLEMYIMVLWQLKEWKMENAESLADIVTKRRPFKEDIQDLVSDAIQVNESSTTKKIKVRLKGEDKEVIVLSPKGRNIIIRCLILRYLITGDTLPAFMKRCYISFGFYLSNSAVKSVFITRMLTPWKIKSIDKLSETDSYCLSNTRAECQELHVPVDSLLNAVVPLNVGKRVH